MTGDIIHTVNIHTFQQDINFDNFFCPYFDNRIVYINFSNMLSGYNLNLANTEGSGRYPIFPILEEAYIGGVTWSINGHHIIFSAKGGLYDNGAIVSTLPDSTILGSWPVDNPIRVTIFPNSSYVAYESGDNIFILNLINEDQ